MDVAARPGRHARLAGRPGSCSLRGADSGVMRQMTENNITSEDLCRCVLYNLERQYTERDLTLLAPQEMADAGTKATVSCMESMLG